MTAPPASSRRRVDGLGIIASAAIFTVIGFSLGLLVTGGPDPAERADAATKTACRTWAVDGSAATAEVDRLRQAVAEGGFEDNPGAEYADVVRAAKSAASTPGLDDKTFGTFSNLARRADAATRAMTPFSAGLLDHDVLDKFQDALADVATTCHGIN
jgi:hypothetical protein